jgi:hypothetical protein
VVRRVVLAGVPNEDGPLLHGVAMSAVGRAHVDAMLVVEAPAEGVALDDEVAHSETAECVDALGGGVLLVIVCQGRTTLEG